MYKEINWSEIESRLNSSQRSLVAHAYEFSAISTENFRTFIQEGQSAAQVFPYPVRLLLEENIFLKISGLFPTAPPTPESPENITDREDDRHLDIVCLAGNDRALRVLITRCREPFEPGIDFEKSLELDKNPSAQEVLLIAGFLAAYPGKTCDTSRFDQVNDNFYQLPFSVRRFLIENIILAVKPSEGFLFLDSLGYLSRILPEVTAGKNLSQNKFHKYDIFEHLIRSCDAMETPDIVLRFSSLLHDIGKVPTRKVKENGEATFYNHEIISSHMLVPVMKRFGIPKSTGMRVKYYGRNHMFHYTDEWSDKAVRRFLRKVTREDLQNLILLRKSDRLGSGKKDPFPKKLQQLIEHIDEVIQRDLELKVTDLEIGGMDLMEMGLKEGPNIGKILNQLLKEVKEEITPNNREVLLEKARDMVRQIPVRAAV